MPRLEAKALLGSWIDQRGAPCGREDSGIGLTTNDFFISAFLRFSLRKIPGFTARRRNVERLACVCNMGSLHRWVGRLSKQPLLMR